MFRRPRHARSVLLVERPSATIRFDPPKVLALGFACLIFAGAALLRLPFASASGGQTDFLTALFTATSAVCVTGLVTVDTATHWSSWGQTIILGLIQVGGLSFMSLAVLVFLLMGKRVGLRERILLRESFSQVEVAGMVRLVRAILVYALAAEALGALLLTLRWLPEHGLHRAAWLGLFHAVSAFNNAGFDLMGGFRSMAAFAEDPIVVLSIGALFILGGIGFSVVLNVWERRERRFSTHTRLVLFVTGCLVGVGTVALVLFEWSNGFAPLSGTGKLLGGFFMAATPRTAGFSTVDVEALRPATQFFILLLMFVGASPGSTGGGIKTSTLGLLAAAVWSLVKGREEVEVMKRRIPQEQVNKALAVALLSFMLVALVTLALSATETGSFLAVLFEAVSAFGTVGLSMNLTPTLSRLGQALIIATMYIGRLGPLTLVVALTRHRAPRQLARHAEDRVLLG